MDANIKQKYEMWLSEPSLTEIEKMELRGLKENQILDQFGADLEFGTAGIRGVMGIGTNRMNKYVVRQATQGLADYLNKGKVPAKVAIAYDSRNNSELFAKETASVLAANGIKVYIYKELMPVPALSFAVRELRCSAGVVITASHNPKQYNGYKVYGPDGCQMTINAANAVLENIKNTHVFRDIKKSVFVEQLTNGQIEHISDDVINKYYASVLSQSIKGPQASPRILKIAYTPLHGAGLKPVTSVLKADGFENIDIVEEQRLPDGDFTTCPYPNPELKEAMELGIKLMLEKDDDICIATDPDSDRAGVCVNHHKQPVMLTGNEMGILLFDFICTAREEENKMPQNPVVVKTIVSSDLINLMAAKHGVKVIDVLTGFKFIGEQIHLLEQAGHVERYLFGFEESCGYLTNPAVRDKDAVNANLLICEMANYYKHRRITLVDRLNELYNEFGDYKTVTLSYEISGLNGKERIAKLMEDFRNPEIQAQIGEIDHIGDYELQKIIYKKKEENTYLPKSNVVKLFLKDNETVTFRPSGTEPKIKAYIFAHGETRLKELKDIINSLIK